MKSKIITSLKKELLIIQWQNDYEIIGQVLFGNSEQKGVLKNLVNLEGYTLLGSPDEIKEDDAKKLVHLHENGYYKDYINENKFFTLPSKSFYSALESEIYWNVNPIDIKGQTFSNEHENKWQQAQEKTFDRSRTLIFVKN